MKYIIIGGGPSGLSLAYFLSQNNIKVELLEMDKQLGGSWNSQWIEDKYFSENSPRVLVLNEYLKKFLNDLNLNNKNNLVSVYGNFFSSNIKMLKFILKNFNLKDYFIFIISFLCFLKLLLSFRLSMYFIYFTINFSKSSSYIIK